MFTGLYQYSSTSDPIAILWSVALVGLTHPIDRDRTRGTFFILATRSDDSSVEICFEHFEFGHRRHDWPWRDRKVGDPNYLNGSQRNYSKLHIFQKQSLVKIGHAPHFALIESTQITNPAGKHVKNSYLPRPPNKEEMDKESKASDGSQQ